MLTKYSSYFGQVVSDSSCSLIMNNADCLNGVLGICCQLGSHSIKVGSLTPLTFNNIHIEPKALLLIDPQQAELANQERYDPISRRQCVGKSTLPGTSAYKCPVRSISLRNLAIYDKKNLQVHGSRVSELDTLLGRNVEKQILSKS